MYLVAKSYQDLTQISGEYTVNGKSYVDVQMKNGSIRRVRTYTQEEYTKFYGGSALAAPKKTKKEALGFKNGYITIFKGDTYSCKQWFKEIGATYRRLWGWGLSSELELPEMLPTGIEPIKLNWEEISLDDENLKSDEDIQSYINSIIYDESPSQFIGAIGERLELYLIVDRAINLDGFYGVSTMHIMHDENENVFVWTTGSRSWEEGTEHHIRGTVKDHKMYKNTRQTILNRCSEVKNK